MWHRPFVDLWLALSYLAQLIHECTHAATISSLRPDDNAFSTPLIARNQGHFELANNYQWYIVLHSGTIEYQENSIWRRSRLDLQRSVFRTMTYTIWAPQIFYLMKRKRKEDLQVNLWDFSRPSDDMMSEFWFALMKFSRQDYWICIERLAYFYSEKDLRTNLLPWKNINKCGRRFEDQRCPCLTISVIVTRHLLNMENKGYSGTLRSFLMGGNGNFTGYLDASNSVAVNSIESSWLYWCTFL